MPIPNSDEAYFFDNPLVLVTHTAISVACNPTSEERRPSIVCVAGYAGMITGYGGLAGSGCSIIDVSPAKL
jgi:hypothetical protein